MPETAAASTSVSQKACHTPSAPSQLHSSAASGMMKKLFQLTLLMSAAIMAAGTVICQFASGQLMGLFTQNPETITAGQTALRIISIGFVISAVSTTASGALEGLGKGAESLVIALCRYVIFIMPLTAPR